MNFINRASVFRMSFVLHSLRAFFGWNHHFSAPYKIYTFNLSKFIQCPSHMDNSFSLSFYGAWHRKKSQVLLRPDFPYFFFSFGKNSTSKSSKLSIPSASIFSPTAATSNLIPSSTVDCSLGCKFSNTDPII